MATECWFRNPHSYIRECAELLVRNIAWDRGTLHKYKIDPNRHIELYYPAEVDYRLLAIGEQGAAELRRGRTMQNPAAVYPVWVYALDGLEVLEEMLAQPIGLSERACRESKGPPDERPVLGQEHRVVITSLPSANTGPGRQIIRHLIDLQHEYPESILHLHGPTTFRIAFGLGFRSADIDVRTAASKGSVQLANGKHIRHEDAVKFQQWVTLTGMSMADLAVARNRCMFNMISAQWAADHWAENVRFAITQRHSGDHEMLPAEVTKPYRAPAVGDRAPAVGGDRFLCDTCSLQSTCKYYRHQGVCSVPDAEPASLARFFKTRDSDLIIEGLGTLLAAQSRRLESGMAAEQFDGELDPEVTKVINSLFTNGVRLAKLVDPRLAAAGAPKTLVQINQGPTTANALMAGIIAELEARGTPRGEITTEMVHDLLASPKAIDVESDVA